jgi:hypothetical protein
MRLRLLENLHLPFWLIKDACWALVWRPLGLIMIAPTLLLSVYLTWNCRRNMGDFLPNLSVTLWITANSIWMTDEFYNLGIKSYCLYFFAAGITSIAVWLIKYFPRLWKISQEN